MIDYLTANGFGPETQDTLFTRPSEDSTGLIDDIIVLAEDAPALGLVNLASFAFAAPVLNDHIRPEFFG